MFLVVTYVVCCVCVILSYGCSKYGMLELQQQLPTAQRHYFALSSCLQAWLVCLTGHRITHSAIEQCVHVWARGAVGVALLVGYKFVCLCY